MIKEGMMNKGGRNLKPFVSRPKNPPKGQGIFDKPYPNFRDAVITIEAFKKAMKDAAIKIVKHKKPNEDKNNGGM